ELTQEERERVNGLAAMAAGLAGAVTGGSVGDAAAAAGASENAVENNFLNEIAKGFIDASNQKAEMDCYQSGYCQEQGIGTAEKEAYIAHLTEKNLQKINETLKTQADSAVLITTTAAL